MNTTTELLVAWLPSLIMRLNEALSHQFNRLAGHSWIFDNLVALPLENDLVKAGVIGACFVAAWQWRDTQPETQAARRRLLVTLFAAALVVTTTKATSHAIFLPRPFVQSQQVYFLEQDQLVAGQRLPYRVPLDQASQDSYQQLRAGDIEANDLGSFPSDHAGFFFTVSLGIWLASRRLGLLALIWTGGVILASKVILGQHTLLDVVAGAAIGATILAACQFVAEKYLRRPLERIVYWTLKHHALSAALLFVAAFEITSTLTHLRPLLKLAAQIGKRLLHGA